MSEKIYRAGVIPYQVTDGKIEMMFMKPSDPKYGGKEFQIAKGRYEDGETAYNAALREASEELGLWHGNITETHDLGTFMGRTSIYLTKIRDRGMFGDPCFETGEVAWLTPEEFEAIGRDLHKPVIKAAVRLIKEKEGLE
jgi:8-oxo-dGTP pyrophosphatase MutT (NUDIX family)